MRIVSGSRRSRASLWLVASAFLALGGVAVAGSEAAAQMLKDGIDLLERGQTEQANAKFRAVLAADPSNEDAYALVKDTDYKVFLSMLKAGGDAEQVAKRLLSLSEAVEVERAKDPAAIKALVDTSINSRALDERDVAARKIAAAHGEYAVPDLVGFLGSNDVEVRTNAILVLTRIGTDAVLPLAASLGLGNDMQKQNTVLLLKRIGDERCDAAIAAATGDKPGAVAKHLAMGKKYFVGDQMSVRNFDRSFTVWSQVEGKLVGKDVPRFAYAYKLAEQCGYDAMALDPANRDARALVALANLGQLVAWDNLSAEAKGNEAIQAVGKSLDGASALAASSGTSGLLDAFAMAAGLKSGDAAARAADLVAATWDGREIGADNALVKGLTDANATVRYAAAIALLRINPVKTFPGSDLVARVAGEAAASRAVKQVLVVDSDSKNAMNVQRALNGAGFHAVTTQSGAEALSMAKATGGFDAIVMATKLDDLSPIAVLAELGRDFRTANVKKIVMAAGDLGDRKAEFEKFGLAGVAPTSADSVGLVKTVQEALASPEGDAGRIRANQVSIAASHALADAGCATFNLKDAQKGLLAAAGEGADPDVQLAALNALGKFATPDAQGALRGLVADAKLKPEIRVAACSALGAAIRGQAPAPETYTALLDAMGDAEVAVRTAAGSALGKAKLSDKQLAEVMNKRRIG